MATRSANGRGIILAVRDRLLHEPLRTASMWWAKQGTRPSWQRVALVLSMPLPTLRLLLIQTLGVRSQCQRWG
jgi:hypothetical protein